MKKIIFYTCMFGATAVMSMYAQTQEKTPSEKFLPQRLELIEKKFDKLNMYMNFQTNWNSYISDSNYQTSYFSVDRLRLEMIGQMNDQISYRFRQLLNRRAGPELNTIDGLSRATDFAFISYKLNDQLSVTVGKQGMLAKGIEFGYNFKNMNVFHTGVKFCYKSLKNHEIQFQVVNNSTDKLLSMYDYKEQDAVGKLRDVSFKKQDFRDQGIETARTPLGYSFNWNGNLWGGKVLTRWSYSIFQESKKNFWKFLTIGTQFNFHPVTIDVDYLRSDEDLDRERYGTEVFRRVRNEVKNGNKLIATNMSYSTYLLKLRYNFAPQWNILLKGAYETAFSKDLTELKDKTFRKSYGYFGGFEYMPMKNSDDMAVHLVYIRSKADYPQPVKDLSSNFHYISLGLFYRLKLL